MGRLIARPDWGVDKVFTAAFKRNELHARGQTSCLTSSGEEEMPKRSARSRFKHVFQAAIPSTGSDARASRVSKVLRVMSAASKRASRPRAVATYASKR